MDMADHLDNGVVGLHWVAGDGTILWANRADYEPLGYTHDEYVGHHMPISTPTRRHRRHIHASVQG